MKKKQLQLFLLLFYSISIFAQKHDYIWTMGYGSTYPNFGGTNINFNTNPPDTDYVKRDINFQWNSGSICDEKGRLVFYTNGCKIFNTKNSLVKNGEGLNPGTISTKRCSNGNIIGQGSLFLPHPTDTSLYYLFHLRPEYIQKNNIGNLADKIYYTLLDKNSDNGNGEALSKNNVIHEDTIAFGKMTAARHGNGRDWWIIVPRMLKNQYIKLLLTDKGIKGPFFQNIGIKNEAEHGTGQSVYSPDGTKFIHFDRYNDLNIFDFDRCTGELSNFRHILLPTARDSFSSTVAKYPKYSVGGVAVSPSSKYLYVTTQTDVFQYNLNSTNIKESVKLIAEYDLFEHTNGLSTRFFLPQIAPDGKIYINCSSSVPYLHVINNPDEEGLACNLTQHSFRLPTLNAFSIPNFPNFRLGVLKGSACDTLNKIATKEIGKDIRFSIYPNPSNGQLTLQYSSENTLETVWKLYNSIGILEYQKIIQSIDNQENINIDNLTGGLYFWHLKSKEKILQSGKLLLIK